MTQPNIPHLAQLAEWLEAGAPHAYFSMRVGLCPATDEGVFEASSNSSLEELFAGSNELDKPACGSVCCIAGAAHLMSIAPEGKGFPSAEAQRKLLESDEMYWPSTQGAAMKYLGFEDKGGFLDHPLFDFTLAPSPCSPAQAAIAVRRVIAGQEPWTAS